MILSSCKSDLIIVDETSDPPVINSSKLDTLWTIKLPSDSKMFSVNPVFWNNMIITSQYNFSDKQTEEIISYDIDSLKQIWMWNNFEGNALEQIKPFGNLSRFVSGDNLIFTSDEIYCLNMNSGSLIWSNLDNNGLIIKSKTDITKFYTTYKNYGWSAELGINTWKHSVFEFTINDGANEEVIGFPFDDLWETQTGLPTVWQNINGEELFLIPCVKFRFDPFEIYSNVYLYNRTLDSIIWYHENLEPEGLNVNPAIYSDGKIYFRTGHDIYCFDETTGNILWQRQISEGMISGNWILHENKLFVNTDNISFYALDPATGNTLWHNNTDCGNVADMVYFKGKIYFGSLGDGKLHCVDASNGNTIWNEVSPNKNKSGCNDASFQNSVAIDSIRNCLYTTDGYFLLSISLPE
ncbi:MAG: PQQ-binding-like beta-propeller repeat protein [Chitinophagales bacterium]